MEKDEFEYKIDAIIKYLEEHDGHNYKVYNHLCPKDGVEPDSDIVEYAEDIKKSYPLSSFNIDDLDITFDDLPF